MDLKCQMMIRSNPNISRFLKENSYYYKMLNRDSNYIYKIEEEMLEKYRLRSVDKLEDFANKLGMVNEFFKIIN